MNNSQLVDLFEKSVKNHSTSVYGTPLVQHWLDETQIDIVLRTRAYTATTNLTSVASQREYNLGTDVMQVLHVMYNSLEVQPATLEELQLLNSYPSETAGWSSLWYNNKHDRS